MKDFIAELDKGMSLIKTEKEDIEAKESGGTQTTSREISVIEEGEEQLENVNPPK